MPVSANAAKLLSVILPAYNEQEVLPLTFARLSAAAAKLAESGFNCELIFVNDGSTDRTMEILNGFAAGDPRVKAVHLTRNFGHQAAISAGLCIARGDVAAVLDSDLQDPPELLPSLLEKWREGYQIVYAIRGKRKEWFGKRLAYWAFYRLLASISELAIPLDSGDFCVMDRRAVDLLNSLPESQRFVRGLRSWVGLRQIGVRYEREARQGGQASYTFRSLRRLAADGLVSFSAVPLRLVTRLGILSGMAAVALGVAIVLARLLLDPGRVAFPWGWSSLACLILLTSSVQLLSIGVIGEYLARIFIEVKRRPTYLIADIVQSGQSPAPIVGTAPVVADVEADARN